MRALIDDFLALPLWKQAALFLVACLIWGFASAMGHSAAQATVAALMAN